MQRSRVIGAALVLALAVPMGSGSVASAGLTRILPSDAPTMRPNWAGALSGWQSGPLGARGEYSWEVEADGRGSITAPGPARTGGRRLIERRFVLTVAEHVRFAGLIERVMAAPPSAALCRSDAARDHVRWSGGTRSGGELTVDRGCEDAATTDRAALLTEALAILRNAAAREEG